MIRRSVSSWVSPGPREPMPPWVRERWVHSRVRRGSWYSSWASSTWSRPSWLRACWAKMSRISPLRSITLTPSRLSSAFCWAGDSSSSATSSVKPVSRFAGTSSSALPLPTYQLGSTWRRFCHSAPTTSAPAVWPGWPAPRATPRRSSRPGADVDGDQERLLDRWHEIDQVVGHRRRIARPLDRPRATRSDRRSYTTQSVAECRYPV